MFSYSEAFILQYNTEEEPHWADPLEMKFQLVDFLVNRRQSGVASFLQVFDSLSEEASGARYGEVDGLFPVAAESERWHLLWVRSGITSVPILM